MNYCLECGTKLEMRFLEDEGEIPYCTQCEMFRFPLFNVAVSVIIHNTEYDQLLLIEQPQRPKNILVAGYVNHGEDAETAVRRETMEEVGLEAIDITFNMSQYYERSNTLMLNFSCSVRDNNFTLNAKEVDHAAWFPIESALDAIAPNSLAKKFLSSFLEKTQ